MKYPASGYVEERNGGLYVAGSRVPLDSIVVNFRRGMSPGEIARGFPTVPLAKVFGVLAELPDQLRARRADRCRRTSFCSRERWCGGLYEPVSAAVVDAAENELGFALPPLLRTIYVELANGGFGPGNGLIGLAGGYTDEDLNDLTLVEYHRMLTIDGEGAFDWPHHCLAICNTGCLGTLAVDCSTAIMPFDELMGRWAVGESLPRW